MAPKPKADKKPAEKKPKVVADKSKKKHKKAVETYKICAFPPLSQPPSRLLDVITQSTIFGF